MKRHRNCMRSFKSGYLTVWFIAILGYVASFRGLPVEVNKARGADEELSDEGSLQVIVYGYDGLPMMPVAPPSPDYIPGPEEPQTPPAPQDEDEHELVFIQPHDPDFVPEPIYPEYIPLEDEHIFPAEEQQLPHVVSPTAESPGYVAESDPEEDPEEYEEDETEDGPVDYPMDEEDDGDDDGYDPSGYDADEEDEEEEEEEHIAPVDSTVVIPIDELASPPKGTEPIIPPPSTDSATTGARITIRPQTSISLPPEAEVERLLAMPTPSPSPLTSLSPPSTGEHIKEISPSYYTHKILMEDDFKPVIHPQRSLNPKVQDVVKNEIVKLLDSWLIYPISDSSWVSPIHVVPKKGGMAVVLND
nr:putative reverse transcriptase domain-containing protein [Tanacetum cinerariifolium]